jgi:glycosyltransferase involved in cell wall biosynthesis
MVRRVKVLHALWSGSIGGTEEYLITLLKHLDYKRYEIHLCFLSEKGPIFEEAKEIENFRVIYIGIKNGLDILGAFRFARYLKNERFDLIHFHMISILSTAVMAVFAGRTPKVLTHHAGPGNIILFKKIKIFYRVFSRFISKVIAISDTVKNSFLNDLSFRNPDKIRIIHNCIDLKKFSPAHTAPSNLLYLKSNSVHKIGFIGRMVDLKRPFLFIEIAEELLKKRKDFYFIMVGDGPQLEECKNMINKLDIDNYFKLLGARRDIPNILKLFDSLLFTSAGEGFGIVLLEAMAMGLAVFAINDGAVSEIVRHKDNGILIDTLNPQEAAKEIIETIEDRKLYNSIRKSSVENVRKRFGIEKCVKKLESVYREVLLNIEN